jgi:hypothetical protein
MGLSAFTHISPANSGSTDPLLEVVALQPTANADSTASTTVYPDQVNVSESVRVFHVFKTLPTEMRLKIWGHAASVERVIE